MPWQRHRQLAVSDSLMGPADLRRESQIAIGPEGPSLGPALFHHMSAGCPRRHHGQGGCRADTVSNVIAWRSSLPFSTALPSGLIPRGAGPQHPRQSGVTQAGRGSRMARVSSQLNVPLQPRPRRPDDRRGGVLLDVGEGAARLKNAIFDSPDACVAAIEGCIEHRNANLCPSQFHWSGKPQTLQTSGRETCQPSEHFPVERLKALLRGHVSRSKAQPKSRPNNSPRRPDRMIDPGRIVF